jgi:FkbM family methyltransferase
MSAKHLIKSAARRFGLQINRYNPVESYEARLFRQLAVHQVDLVVDIGANDGGYGRGLRAGGFQGNILSFEPLPEAHRKLLESASKDPRWYVADRQAIGDAEGEIEINVAGNSASSSVLPMAAAHLNAAPQSRYVGTVKSQIARLDSVRHNTLEAACKVFIKIDTQGYEMPVLQGAGKTLARAHGVQLELSLTTLYEGQALFKDVIDWLSQRGFHLWGVVPGFTDPETGRMLQMDGVFFRDRGWSGP